MSSHPIRDKPVIPSYNIELQLEAVIDPRTLFMVGFVPYIDSNTNTKLQIKHTLRFTLYIIAHQMI